MTGNDLSSEFRFGKNKDDVLMDDTPSCTMSHAVSRIHLHRVWNTDWDLPEEEQISMPLREWWRKVSADTATLNEIDD